MNQLFENVPAELPEELFETILTGKQVRLERIVSVGHATPAGQWYDQEEAEWVAVLQGEAEIRFADGGEPVTLRPGDCLNLPARRRHRVERTSVDPPTIWLALFYAEE